MWLIRRKKTINAQDVTEKMKIFSRDDDDERYYPVRHVEVSYDGTVVILCGKKSTFHGNFQLLLAPTEQVQVKA